MASKMLALPNTTTVGTKLKKACVV